jgi:hypothetical protein
MNQDDIAGMIVIGILLALIVITGRMKRNRRRERKYYDHMDRQTQKPHHSRRK